MDINEILVNKQENPALFEPHPYDTVETYLKI